MFLDINAVQGRGSNCLFSKKIIFGLKMTFFENSFYSKLISDQKYIIHIFQKKY